MSTTDDPLRTQTTAYTRALLVPTEGREGKRVSQDGDPLRTQTCRNELGLLVPYYSASEAGRPTSEPVGTLTTVDRYALIMRNNSSRGSGAEHVTPVREPFRTFTTTGHQSVEPATIDPEDCLFRMLEPHEIALGMAFPADYKWLGSKRARVRMAGAAVCPPSARDLIHAVADSIVGAA